MSFPATRLRRLRRTKPLRDLVRETELTPEHLVQPLFITAGEGVREPIETMPGIERLSISEAGRRGDRDRRRRRPRGAALRHPGHQGRGRAREAYDDEGVIQMAVRALKEAHPEVVVITDVCLCEYTSHGHCGIVREEQHPRTRSGGDAEMVVDNDLTIELLAKTAISHAAAGADAVAPSDMMDGRVGAIRSQLDEEGHSAVPIVAYSAKYASAFYGPFREAADSTPEFGDRRGYQMDPANADEAVREAKLDLEEGADVVMVKPALPYLDVVRRVKDATGAPVAAYHVGGEYSMLKAAAANGWIDERAAAMESLIAIRRAGADMIITYFAKDAAAGCEGAREGDPFVEAAVNRPSDGITTATAKPKLRSREGGAAVPLDETDKRLMNLLQSSFPLDAEPFELIASEAELDPDEVKSRTQRLLDERIIREITPIFDTRALGYSSMLVAAKVDTENPHRAAQIINSHPGVSHNYLRTHEFNLWFTIATPPDSELGLEGTLEVLQELTGAESIRQLPDPAAVQDQHEPGDGGRHRCSSPPRPRRRRRASWSASPTTRPTSR